MKQFMYCESTEGGADYNAYEQEDMALAAWMRSAQVGVYMDHRMGVCIRLLDKEG